MNKTFARLMLFALLGWSILSLACSLSPLSAASTATAQAQLTQVAIGLEQTQQALLILQSTDDAAKTLTAMPTATVNTPTPLPTDTPVPTFTATLAPTASETPTVALPPVAVLNANANLRSGPGVVYAVVVSLTSGTKVTVLERDPDSNWFRVKVDAGGQAGWVSISLVTYQFDLSSISIAQVIPPTPTFAPVQATQPKNTAQPQNFDAHIDVSNHLGVTISISLTGPYSLDFSVGPGQTHHIDIPSGTYNFYSTADGYRPLSGSRTWDAGNWTWDFSAS